MPWPIPADLYSRLVGVARDWAARLGRPAGAVPAGLVGRGGAPRVSTVRSGRRRALGIIFHDAA